MHAAALFGHLPVVKQLVAAGSPLTIRNQDGMTPSQLSREEKHMDVYSYLREKEMAQRVSLH